VAELDVTSTLEGLSHDPALRQTESGRAILRWLSLRLLRPDEWDDVVHQLPPHATYIVASLAEVCAKEWGRLAYSLKERHQEG
jgi:hypothetical protein